MSQRSSQGLTILGIPVEVPLSGIVGVMVLAYVWAPAFAAPSLGVSRWVLAGAFALLLSLATLVHEFAHALLARALGYPVHRVVLQLMGGVTYFQRSRSSPMREAMIAAAGPAATFGLAAVAAAVAGVLPPGGIGWTLARALMWANLVMALYNSLPGLPLDGGTVLRCVIWALTGSERRGVVVAAWSGRAIAVLTLVTPFVLTLLWDLAPDPLLYLLAGLLGVMLYSAAGAQLRANDLRDRISGLTARALARRAFAVERDLPLAEAIRRANQMGAAALVVVDPSGRPTSVGNDAAIAAVPEQRRPWVSVSAVARTLAADSTLPMGLAGEELVAEVLQRGHSEYLLLDDAGLVYGVLMTSDVQGVLRDGPAARGAGQR